MERARGHAKRGPAILQASSRNDQLMVLLKWEEHLQAALRDYNGRYQQAVLLYLGALGAALGLSVSGKLSIAELARYPNAPVVVMLFIALSLLVVFHGVTLSSWSMSFAKYMTVVLGPEIRKASGLSAEFPNFDHWDGDIKAHAVRVRSGGYFLWFLLVLSTCLGALTTVHWSVYIASGISAKTLVIVGGSGLVMLLALTLYVSFVELLLLQHYFDPRPQNVRVPAAIATFITTALIAVVAGALVANS